MELALIMLLCQFPLNISSGAEFLVQVTPQSVRERINLTESAVSDDVVNRFIVDAAETVELETGLTIDPDDCTDAEAVRSIDRTRTELSTFWTLVRSLRTSIVY